VFPVAGLYVDNVCRGRSWVEAGRAVRRSVDNTRAGRGEQPDESDVAHHSIFGSERNALRFGVVDSVGPVIGTYLLTPSFFRAPIVLFCSVTGFAADSLGLVSSYSSGGFLSSCQFEGLE
jgi:hypothetical protein